MSKPLTKVALPVRLFYRSHNMTRGRKPSAKAQPKPQAENVKVTTKTEKKSKLTAKKTKSSGTQEIIQGEKCWQCIAVGRGVCTT